MTVTLLSRRLLMMVNKRAISHLGDCSGRLIHDDDVGLGRDRLGDLHDLFFRHAQASRPAASA